MKYTIDDLRNDISLDFGGGHASASKHQRFKGGGGGGDGGAAARQAAENARVAAAIDHINQVFGISQNANDAAGQRENLYSKIGSDATNTALIDLNKEKSNTERELNFMLSRAGLSGGSRDIDVNKDVLNTYGQGVLKASNIGLSTANNARSSDDKTRVNLINSIRAGLDQGSATQQAYEGMRNNAILAQDDANSATLSGFFDTLRSQQQQAAYIQGINGAVNPIQQYKKTTASSAITGDRGRTGSY